MLVDKFGRQITYLRLAVTDRCNLRCTYCMPAEGIVYEKRKDILTYEEMLFLVECFVELGVTKLRLTGGEPFVRKDFVQFLVKLNAINGLEEINITTNGTLIAKHLDKLKSLKKINAINLSIDSLNKEKFSKITRRDSFETVFETLNLLLEKGFKTKLNVVMIPNVNTNEIKDFIELTKEKNIAVRFIEEMPFNGVGKRKEAEVWDKTKIYSEIKNNYTSIIALKSEKSSTSNNYKIENYKGIFGIIPAYTRTICGGCNRIRITAKGQFKLCLFDDGILNLRPFLRQNASKEDLKLLFYKLIDNKPKNGFEAEKQRKKTIEVSESMSTIGG